MIKTKYPILYLLAVSVLTFSCQDRNSIEKRQKSRDNVVKVKDNIKFLEPDSVLISDFSYIKVLGDYVVIPDLKSSEKLVHLFDRSSLSYIASIGDLGQGPGEIASMGAVAYDIEHDCLQVVDYGSKNIYNFNVDSVKKNPYYLPNVKQKLRNDVFTYEYHFLNDTICIGSFIIRNGYESNDMKIGKWNMQTGEVQLHQAEHPAASEYFVAYDYSKKQDLIVECSKNYDLINLFDSHLNLKKHIYGPEWNENDDRIQHFLSVAIYKDWIIAAYDGKKSRDYGMPLICHVFDLEGNYVKTLDVGYKIWRISVDEANDRLYFSFQDIYQFGYLDLKDILN